MCRLPQLHSLDLSYCRSIIPEHLPNLQFAFPKLTTLKLRGCWSLGAKELGPFLLALPKMDIQKLELSLSGQVTNALVADIAKEIGANAREFDFHGCRPLTDECVASIAQRCGSLQKLHLSECLSLESLPPLDEASFPSLEELNLNETKVGDSAVQELAKCGCKNSLQVLQLSHTRITDNALSTLAQHSFSSLRVLTIERSDMHYKDDVVNSLLQKYPQLEQGLKRY